MAKYTPPKFQIDCPLKTSTEFTTYQNICIFFCFYKTSNVKRKMTTLALAGGHQSTGKHAIGA